ncbi:MAG: coenzyme F420-0:L-glutamate ligase [Nitrososphaerales archaeon]
MKISCGGRRLSAQKSCMVEIRTAEPSRYKATALRTGYWRPGVDYRSIILKIISGVVSDGDFVVVSEKAVSIAKNRLIDESRVEPGLAARLLSKVWMRWIWGHLLGRVCHMTRKTRQRLRNYPLKEGAAHKQVCLTYTGLLQTLRHGSEGGIDVTNLPYSYACLPLKNTQQEAEELQRLILSETGRRVSVMIVDTDKTYRLGGRNYTPLPKAIPGITAGGGVVTYILCRMLRCRRRATPMGYVGTSQSVEFLLNIAETANRARGVGAGRTPWHMAERFGVGLTAVTWEMLERVAHYPVVVVKPLH